MAKPATPIATPATNTATTTNPHPSIRPTVPATKYATSPDPRSTATSTTAPGPTPQDVNIPITHSNQVPVGTLINYNATKNASVYYGGDLVFNPGEVTISEHTSPKSPLFTVSIPDGQTTMMPTMPWNDQSSIAFPATNGSAASATSWSIFLQLDGVPAPSTTPYYIHLVTFRTGESGDVTWEYDGFVPLYVNS
ncbi:MAG TPA: hypothetical protein VGS08_04875 [Candidatus Saccharimonadales bacterium]|nr:hypothetical protein [Candidatus Saccharimonadales bacterium]